MIAEKTLIPIKHAKSQLLHRYADKRIGATNQEKYCFKKTDSILLTFDDYGTRAEVNEILRILKNKKVKAMFFLQGDWAETEPGLVRKITKSGHIVGNHTYSHRILKKLPPHQIIEEITKGLPSEWLRPPQGRYDEKVRQVANSLGYKLCYWTIDSRDWTGATVPEMRYTILSELHKGAVVLFHLHGKNTRELLPGLIDEIRGRNYCLTDSSEKWS